MHIDIVIDVAYPDYCSTSIGCSPNEIDRGHSII